MRPALIAAGFNGGRFLNVADALNSLIMSSGFAIAVAASVIGLYSAR